MIDNEISIVIGSWGSYNECNERALGSKWLTLNEYDSWEQIEQELQDEGFILDGIDEELFVQDIDNFPAEVTNWDYVHPKELFDTLKESGVLDSESKYEVMQAFCEVRGYDEFRDRVEDMSDNWDDSIYLYKDMDWCDFGEYFIKEICCIEVPEMLDGYIDYAGIGESKAAGTCYTCESGIIEID